LGIFDTVKRLKLLVEPKNLLILVFLILFVICPLFSQTKIAKIYLSGLEKTKESYLHYFIQSAENTPFDSLKLLNDVQRLLNLRLFKDVTFTVTESKSGKIIEIHCSELFTLIPIVNFGGVTGNFWFQVGGMDYNLLGRGHTLGGYYRYYDRHSFVIFAKAPYLFDNHWGLSLDLARFSTIEPAYLSEAIVPYKVDRWNFTTYIIYNFSFYNNIEFGGGYLYESYEKNEIDNGEFIPGPAFRDFDKFLVKFLMRNDYINYNYQYIRGFSNELYLEGITTTNNNDLFWKILNISKIFFRLGDEGNLAFRLRLGVSTNKDSPFVPFVLDNYINVRGSGNRVSRGTAEMTTNYEYRHTLLEQYLGAVQGVVFMDMSAWRPAAGSFSEMFEDKNNVTFGGLGLRFYLRRINNFIIRIDYGISVTGNKGRGIVFGAGQYF
jgi:outer membrane protein assembly factor BamA